MWCPASKFDSFGRRQATSVVHEQIMRYGQPSGTAVVTESRVIGAFFAAATLIEVAAVCEVKPDAQPARRSWVVTCP